jgi:DNA (cytosine-5)-methyltransferase 1
LRFVKVLQPRTVMMENVPALENYYLFKKFVSKLRTLNYHVDHKVVDVSEYGVPQRRRRLVLLASILGTVSIAEPTGKRITVRQAIGKIKSPKKTKDWLQRVMAAHSPEIKERIRLIPKNGGSFRNLAREYQLDCHKGKNVGFKDIYGRMKWNDVAPTITGGCMNPSKGRFLHPEKNRSITAREAAVLQSFRQSYKFYRMLNKTELAIQIGNALPPKFSKAQTAHLKRHLQENLGWYFHQKETFWNNETHWTEEFFSGAFHFTNLEIRKNSLSFPLQIFAG